MNMPISNFHTHTQLCGHALGVCADYAAAALRDGCSALGFSDHCPYPDGTDTWSNIRMNCAQGIPYIAAVREAGAKCPFPVYAGFECEWDNDYRSWYSDTLLGTFKADYLVLGSHWVTVGGDNQEGAHLYAMDIADAAAFHRYVAQTIEGIRSGLFAFIAHPDLFMGGWREWDGEAKAASSAIIDAAIDCGLPLEVNGLGMKKGDIETKHGVRHQYPYVEFWQMAKDKGAKVICNSDAHNPKAVIADARCARDFAHLMDLDALVIDNLRFDVHC